MKFEKVNVEEVKALRFKKTKWMSYLDAFANSDAKEIELVDDQNEYKNAYSMVSSIRASIERFDYAIRVISVRGHVYLAKPSSVLYSL